MIIATCRQGCTAAVAIPMPIYPPVYEPGVVVAASASKPSHKAK